MTQTLKSIKAKPYSNVTEKMKWRRNITKVFRKLKIEVSLHYFIPLMVGWGVLLLDHQKISWKMRWTLFSSDVLHSKKDLIFDDKISKIDWLRRSEKTVMPRISKLSEARCNITWLIEEKFWIIKHQKQIEYNLTLKSLCLLIF